MPRVICDLPNASDEISGVKFHKLDDGGMISDEVSLEQAERFAKITGYTIDDGSVQPPVVPEQPKAPTARKGGGKKAAQPPVEPPAPAVDETHPVDPDNGGSETQPNESTGGAGEADPVF